MEWLIVILICITYLLGFLHGGRYVLKKLRKTSTQEFDADNPERLQNRLDAQSKEIDRLRNKLDPTKELT